MFAVFQVSVYAHEASVYSFYTRLAPDVMAA